MPKEKTREIIVTTIFEGRQDGQKAFVDLMLHRLRTNSVQELENGTASKYTHNKVFSDIHAERKDFNHEQFV